MHTCKHDKIHGWEECPKCEIESLLARNREAWADGEKWRDMFARECVRSDRALDALRQIVSECRSRSSLEAISRVAKDALRGEGDA